MRYALIAVLALLAACGTPIGKLEPGMSMSQVRDVMGPPDGQSLTGDPSIVVLHYKNRFLPWAGPNAIDYYAVMSANGLMAYGQSDARIPRNDAVTVFQYGG